MTITRRLAAAVLLTGALTVPALPAVAGGDDDVERRGSCSGRTDWKLKADEDDGRIEVEAEVDSNRTGQRWSWTLWHNGEATARGTGVTRAPSGSFEVRRMMVDLRGSDRIAPSARNKRTGETCRGSLRF